MFTMAYVICVLMTPILKKKIKNTLILLKKTYIGWVLIGQVRLIMRLIILTNCLIMLWA